MTSLQKVNIKPSIPSHPVSTGGNQAIATINAPLNSDKFQFCEDISADLNFDAEKSISGTVYSGTINCKNSTFKIIDEDEDLPVYYEGFINNKKIKMASHNNECAGVYGDKKFRFNIEYNEPSKISYFFNHTVMGKVFKPDYFIIKGNIGNTEVDLKLPNIKTPNDNELKDVLALILFSNGLEARTFDNKIVALDYSTLKRSDIRKSKKRRTQMYNEDVKPLISQAISTASGIIIGAVMTTLLGKLKLKR